MKPPEPEVPPKKVSAKKSTAMPTTAGTALVSAVRGVISETEDPEQIAKARAMVTELGERPRRSVTITEEGSVIKAFTVLCSAC